MNLGGPKGAGSGRNGGGRGPARPQDALPATGEAVLRRTNSHRINGWAPAFREHSDRINLSRPIVAYGYDDMQIKRRDILKYIMCLPVIGLFMPARVKAEKTEPGASYPLFGVNLPRAEFEAIGGRWGWPPPANMNFFLSLGIRIFRIPFIWSRLQPVLNGPLDEAGMAGLDALVKRALDYDAVIILDVHDYGRRGGKPIGAPGNPATADAFAGFWGLLAKRYGDSPLVWYGLMNEPHDQDAQTNLVVQNAACRAIRENGGTGKVLFSGIAWTGAHSWIKSGNGEVMLQAVDPGNNYCFDMHQYLDEGFGGGSPIAIKGIGAHILKSAHEWAIKNDMKIFIGETSAGENDDAIKELRDLLSFIARNPDVFIGATYWKGGDTIPFESTVVDKEKIDHTKIYKGISLFVEFANKKI